MLQLATKVQPACKHGPEAASMRKDYEKLSNKVRKSNCQTPYHSRPSLCGNRKLQLTQEEKTLENRFKYQHRTTQAKVANHLQIQNYKLSN